ncbi:MAG TPA: energy transducer TonB, partial [Pseudomonas pachastrellae]|nr:energy transducer TonB [Halopseudomonas pachastrellae]
MYEATRLAYLEALGVTNWIPRDPLSGVPARPPALLLPEAELQES